MKTMFVHASVKDAVDIPLKHIEKLPKRIGLFTTIQFLKQLPKWKKQIEEAGKTVTVLGQTLGCRADAALTADVDCFLFVGSGQFHPLQVAYMTAKPVYCYHPISKGFFPIEKEDIEKHHTRRKVNIMKFLHAEKVGILVSTKIGQNDNKINKYSVELKMKGVHELLERGDKQYYVFAFDTLSPSLLEDFPFIDCWVNVACSRIADEKLAVVNLDDLRVYFSGGFSAVAPKY
ncbi:hypothetical protein GF342_03245 [Candidatus Woesearchaeota archaeon]|nr:hypothetical protein [Candidatus Woesearchaeota archaeon]